MNWKLWYAQKKLAFGYRQQYTTLNRVFWDGFEETIVPKLLLQIREVISKWKCSVLCDRWIESLPKFYSRWSSNH